MAAEIKHRKARQLFLQGQGRKGREERQKEGQKRRKEGREAEKEEGGDKEGGKSMLFISNSCTE